MAYLVSPVETNNDASNYWMFSPGGLDRIAERAGWTVLERASFGDVTASDPASPEHDERAFTLLGSVTREDGPSEPTDAPSGRRRWPRLTHGAVGDALPQPDTGSTRLTSCARLTS